MLVTRKDVKKLEKEICTCLRRKGSVTRKDVKQFENEVCTWLRCNGVDITKFNIESHIEVKGYVICYNGYNFEHVIINMDEWSKYLSVRYKNIREEDLQKLRNM